MNRELYLMLLLYMFENYLYITYIIILNYVYSLLKVTYRPMGPGVLSLYKLCYLLVHVWYTCHYNKQSSYYLLTCIFPCFSNVQIECIFLQHHKVNQLYSLDKKKERQDFNLGKLCPIALRLDIFRKRR